MKKNTVKYCKTDMIKKKSDMKMLSYRPALVNYFLEVYRKIDIGV